MRLTSLSLWQVLLHLPLSVWLTLFGCIAYSTNANSSARIGRITVSFSTTETKKWSIACHQWSDSLYRDSSRACHRWSDSLYRDSRTGPADPAAARPTISAHYKTVKNVGWTNNFCQLQQQRTKYYVHLHIAMTCNSCHITHAGRAWVSRDAMKKMATLFNVLRV